MTGPVGGAGELTALSELSELVRRMESEEQGKLWGYGTILEYCKDRLAKLKKLAAKAPQGVPHSLVSQLKDYIWQLREVGNYRCTQTANDIERMLNADASPKLPAAGPVSDDTIHHGMGPPLAVSKLADEVNQCLQIILTNAGNIKQDRQGPIFEDCLAIEEAVERASKATWAALRGDSNGKP